MQDNKPHIHKHTRKNGVQVMVTTEHRDRLYRRGAMPANYQMPAIPDERDCEWYYLIALRDHLRNAVLFYQNLS